MTQTAINPQLNPQSCQSSILSPRSLRQRATLSIEHNYATVWIEVNDGTPVEQIVLNQRPVSTRTTNPPLRKPIKLAFGLHN